MAIPTTTEVADEPNDDMAMITGLIARKEAGEPVDADILALLTDMEQVGLTNTEAYVALDAYRPGSAVGATGGEDEAVSEA
ncbi:hypothetical protein MKK65_04915 [Methylobacterium sp. J-001]|uniref:hypothetical protein n=1 Tax=Methylobacterium sp. J-001 TaxID=2836609 RepID=UPI001FBA35C4|nr:hypothetical protein [Methylobacterium sp. J-001]MCJ2115939.1 hypothetical protein [Methylobacterium sp. J-001]